MVQRIGGMRRKSRQKFKKYFKRQGKISLTRFFQQFEVGARVALVAEPAYQKALYKARFHGRSGSVVGSQGRCYKVQIVDGSKEKVLIVHPVHLKKITHG